MAIRAASFSVAFVTLCTTFCVRSFRVCGWGWQECWMSETQAQSVRVEVSGLVPHKYRARSKLAWFYGLPPEVVRPKSDQPDRLLQPWSCSILCASHWCYLSQTWKNCSYDLHAVKVVGTSKCSGAIKWLLSRAYLSGGDNEFSFIACNNLYYVIGVRAWHCVWWNAFALTVLIIFL